MCVFVLVNFMTISSILTAATAAWTLFVVVPVVVPCTNRQKEYMIASATQTWEEMNCGFGHQLVAGSALDRLQNCTGSSLHTCNTRSLSPRLQFSSKDRQDWCGIFSEMVKRESPTLPCVSFLWSLSPSHLISLKLRIVITSLPGWPFHLRFLHLQTRLAVLIWQETLKIASGIWWQMNIRGWSSLLLS